MISNVSLYTHLVLLTFLLKVTMLQWYGLSISFLFSKAFATGSDIFDVPLHLFYFLFKF